MVDVLKNILIWEERGCGRDVILNRVVRIHPATDACGYIALGALYHCVILCVFGSHCNDAPLARRDSNFVGVAFGLAIVDVEAYRTADVGD
ncbi:hypothetical protein [Acidithrix sp. C25]|uniref:hypothetical protein n=1 Tax=Acidithrix sp. C25 TaxID=1671482 RepID=UPI00191BB18B|nr:hypothetical protein [Acidithrix sp. C25]